MKKLIFLITIIINIILLTGCEVSQTGVTNTYAGKEEAITSNQQAVHLQTTKPPILRTSLERKQLIKRLTRFNVDNKISYLYLLTDFGKIIGYYTVKGKVSSVNSLLTNPNKIIEEHYNGVALAVMASPDLDGSYGSNGDAIFFFTTEDAYVEYNGKYLLCDQPIPMDAPHFKTK